MTQAESDRSVTDWMWIPISDKNMQQQSSLEPEDIRKHQESVRKTSGKHQKTSGKHPKKTSGDFSFSRLRKVFEKEDKALPSGATHFPDPDGLRSAHGRAAGRARVKRNAMLMHIYIYTVYTYIRIYVHIYIYIMCMCILYYIYIDSIIYYTLYSILYILIVLYIIYYIIYIIYIV